MASRLNSARRRRGAVLAALAACAVRSWADDGPPVPLTPFAAGSVAPGASGLSPTNEKPGTFASPDMSVNAIPIGGGQPVAAAPGFIQGPPDPVTGGVPFTNDFGHTLAVLKPGTLVQKLKGKCGADGYCK